MGLVRHTISKYYPNLLKDEDVYQVACMGLIKAATLYDPTTFKFSTYAVLGIKYAIINHFAAINIYKRKSNISTKSLDYPISKDFLTSLGDFFETKDFTDMIDLKITINEVFKKLKSVDKKILAMRLAGYTFEEVGQEVSLTKQNVHWRVRNKIKPVVSEQLRETNNINILGRSNQNDRC